MGIWADGGRVCCDPPPHHDVLPTVVRLILHGCASLMCLISLYGLFLLTSNSWAPNHPPVSLVCDNDCLNEHYPINKPLAYVLTQIIYDSLNGKYHR